MFFWFFPYVQHFSPVDTADKTLDHSTGNSAYNFLLEYNSFTRQRIVLVTHNQGIVVSPDSGATWSVRNPAGLVSANGFLVKSLAVHPADAQHWVAVIHKDLADGKYTVRNGLYETLDGREELPRVSERFFRTQTQRDFV